jgi:ABC-type multidrug transport system ATPase subunit
MCKSRDMIAIASLHQPRREIFLEIDHMMLLAHGRAVYCGPSREMVPFIETFHRPIESQENPADFAIDFLFKLKDEQAEQLANANEKMQGPVPMEGAWYISLIEPVCPSPHCCSTSRSMTVG